MKRSFSLFISLFCLALSASGQKTVTNPELDALVNSERAFAKTCVEKGLRASFTEFFADDGISFSPHPVNTKENFRKRPAPAGPQAFTLNWEPIFADISRAGDLGYTTGPVISSDNAQQRPPRYSFYFSVWKKQPDGNWKVLVDYGTGTPTPADPTRRIPFTPATPSQWKASRQVDPERERTALMNLEREVSTATANGNVPVSFGRYLMDESRMHRDGLMPVLTKAAIISYLTQQQLTRLSFEPMAAGVAASGDLGYTYGKYELEKKGAAVEKGYVVRVWKRDRHGDWKIVAVVANARGPDEK